MRVCRIAVRNRKFFVAGHWQRLSGGAGGGLDSKDVKILQPASDRFRNFADQGGRSPPQTHREAHPRCKVRDKWIAVVFEVKFEAFGRKDSCTSCRPAILSRKRQC